jgi:uncharacterized DUF497 family protein
MKKISWSSEKNAKLKAERNIGFEDVLIAFSQDKMLDDIGHPNQEKYAHQSVFIMEINDYAYIVPYIENDNELFLKTIIPSRKMTKKYLRGKS